MFAFLRVIFREIARTVASPRRLLGLFDRGKVRAFLRSVSMQKDALRHGGPWVAAEPGSAVRTRSYKSYEDYLEHQQSKLGVLQSDGELSDEAEYQIKYREALRQRLEAGGLVRPGMSALCLAARLGAEVRAFLDLGCFAVGIDLNPGPANRYVLHGDFHDVQFPAGSVDVVFSNALDHAFKVETVIEQIKALLKPGGLLIVEAVAGSEEGGRPGLYESTDWQRTDDLRSLIEAAGFALERRARFDYPWQGDHFAFEKQGR